LTKAIRGRKYWNILLAGVYDPIEITGQLKKSSETEEYSGLF